VGLENRFVERLPLSLHILALAQALLLIAVANGVPVLAKWFLGDRWSWPLDGGLVLRDGQRLFGKSKTIRGIALAVLCSTLAAQSLGIGAWSGLVSGLGAMAGDLVSSFTKRRMGLEASSMAPGIDQVPESALPLLLMMDPLGLSAVDVALGVAVFWLGELALSRLLFRIGMRDRPY
jgi:CDP-diglyceride synthetase